MAAEGRGRPPGVSSTRSSRCAPAARCSPLLAFGYGPVPALGRALDPGHGAWASAPRRPAAYGPGR